MNSWKTSLLGVLTIAFVGFGVYKDPQKATNVETLAALSAGVGLLAAKDFNKSGSQVR